MHYSQELEFTHGTGKNLCGSGLERLLKKQRFQILLLTIMPRNYVDRILYYLLDGGICRDLEFYSSIGPDHSGLCNWDSGTGSRI